MDDLVMDMCRAKKLGGISVFHITRRDRNMESRRKCMAQLMSWVREAYVEDGVD